ncbi:MAG: hypothetical protein RLN62_02760 [Rickettsiales bacterium]
MTERVQKAELGYWMKDLESPAFRGRVIRELMDLMDAEYQERKWEVVQGRNYFREEMYFSFELIADDLMSYYVENNEQPYEQIGVYLKTKPEAEILYAIGETLLRLFRENKDDQSILSSPDLQLIRKLSKEAFIEFMKGEKDNEKFCEFIIECMKAEGRDYKIDANKADYENIIAFAESR